VKEQSREKKMGRVPMGVEIGRVGFLHVLYPDLTSQLIIDCGDIYFFSL
jgi:hypothetical protein